MACSLAKALASEGIAAIKVEQGAAEAKGVENSVDVVFTTYGSSDDRLLRDSYRPKVVIGDEAASTTIPDALTPVGAFLEHVELLVLAGDEKQQKPAVASRGSNEYFNVLSKSLIEVLKKSRALSNSVVELNMQHRMHPDLSDMLSRLWFSNSSLVNAPKSWEVTPKWRTLRTLFNRLGRSWNGRRRVAYDVSGNDVRSEIRDTSFINTKEVEAICDIIEAALRQSPPASGAKILEEDIMVLTPYRAQVDLIKEELAKRSPGNADSRIKVSTIKAIQSTEAKIVLDSLVKNNPYNPLDLGFIHESQMLNMAFSRAQEALIVFGNIAAWARSIDEGVEIIATTHSRFGLFGRVIKVLLYKRDRISYGEFKRWMAAMGEERLDLSGLSIA